MTTKAALFALFALWGVGACPVPSFAEDSSIEQTAVDGSPMKRSLVNRVWTKAEDPNLPGVVRIFLGDGTLVSDSCWETHRLSPWHFTSDTALSWDEDGMEITADILSVSATDLVLKLNLTGGAVEEHYIAAEVPYVCPDVPKA